MITSVIIIIFLRFVFYNLEIIVTETGGETWRQTQNLDSLKQTLGGEC